MPGREWEIVTTADFAGSLPRTGPCVLGIRSFPRDPLSLEATATPVLDRGSLRHGEVR